eukprot:3219300-Rhodomonas_salina.1
MAKQSVRIVLQTSYSIGTLVCMILNAIIPFDTETVMVKKVVETCEEIDDWSEHGGRTQHGREPLLLVAARRTSLLPHPFSHTPSSVSLFSRP